MTGVNEGLLILHFLGLTMGLSVSIANVAMSTLMVRATVPERLVLGRLPPIMSRIGKAGLGLLWTTGVILVYSKWGGFATLPWQFRVKLTAVVLLTLTVVHIHRLERLVRKGDAAALQRIELAGKIATALAMIAIVFAVLTFN